MPKVQMSSIVIANEYQSVHTKNWTVPPKPEPLGVERTLKGPVKLKQRDGLHGKKPTTVEYDSPDEMLKGMQQQTDKVLQTHRYPDQDSFKNVEKQTSQGMWSHELVAKIRKLNPKLIVQDSLNVKGCAAFYKMVGETLTYTNASFRHGFMPEFTIMKADTADLVTDFVYGWRTVLMRLVKSGDLKQAVVDKTFGFVMYSDERAKHYNANVQEFR